MKLRQVRSQLTMTGAFLLALVTIPAKSQTTQGVSAYDHGLRHFYWLYIHDPVGHQRRDWYQESSSAWNEVYEDGRYNHPLIVDAHAVVDGNTGIIAKAETSTLRLFIPDRNASGSNPQWLRLQQQGASTWTLFAKKFEVDRLTQLIAATQQVEIFNRIDFTTLQRRAASGDATAEFWLGYRFYNGIGISQDFGQAAAWFRKAADQGRPDAQYYLGMINARGYGVAPDARDARVWFQLAAAQGHQGAKDELAKLDTPPPQPPPINSRAVSNIESGVSAESLAASTTVKVDVDASDIAALRQKLAFAHDHKLNVSLDLASGSQRGDAKRALAHCNKKNYHDDAWDNHSICADLTYYTSAKEAVLLRGCSFPLVSSNSQGGAIGNSCLRLGELYESQQRSFEALAVYQSPNIEDKTDKSAIRVAEAITRTYKSLGNNATVKSELHRLCYDLSVVHSCKELQSLGEKVDMEDAYRRRNEAMAQQRADAAQRRADDERDRRLKAESRAETIAAITGAVNQTMASIQQTQAEMAQARVNAAAIKMAQQNKGSGGYPTSSGGASSTSGSSSASSTNRAPKKNTTTETSDSSDSSSDSSADSSSTSSNSDKPFNAYTSTGGGYNGYSGQGVPPEGSTTPGEKGHWVETEMNVTCYSKDFPNTLISAVLVNLSGNPDCLGGYVSFSNPDKHPFYYGFAGVINERMEGNSTRNIRWPAPYIAANRSNQQFSAKVSIRYFAAD